MTINSSPAAQDASSQANMYIIFLNADSRNARSMFKFIATLSNVVKSDLSGTFQLGAVPDDLNGTNILVHGYSAYALPTWHDMTTTTGHKFSTEQDEEEYAKALGFMQPSTFSGTHSQKWIKDDEDLVTKMYLIQKGKHEQKNEPKDLVEEPFNPDTHVAPRTVFLDPYTSGDGPISYSMLAGLIIESAEVDGSSVPLPNTNIGLSKINRDFLQGALPLSRSRHGLNPRGHDNIQPSSRTVLKGQLQKISHDLYGIEKNRLGFMDSTTDSTFPTQPYGFNLIYHIRNKFQMFSKLSFTSAETPSPTSVTLTIWSPYRYVSNDEDAHPSDACTYMLFNHRALYGTHIPLVASRHPSTIIPIS
jgi:hypothetical protein